MSRHYVTLLLIITMIVAVGCGKITGSEFGYAPSPRTIVATPASPASGDITIAFHLVDRELETGDVAVEYSTDNGQIFSSCTLVNPGEAVNLASAWHPGVIHTVTWDSVADGLAISGDETVCVRITPSDASNPSGTAGLSGPFTVNNTAYNLPPTATVATPAGIQFGNIQITYSLEDTESDTCFIEVLYSTNDGTSWQTASMAPAGEGLTGLSSSPSGTAHAFLWDSRADNVAPTGQLDTVKVKITPTDFHVGSADETISFSVDNSITNNPPTVNITSGPADGSTVTTNQVTFGWSGSDTDGSVIGYYYSFDHDPPDVWTTDTTATSDPLSEGQHTFRVVAMDDDNDLSAVASRVFTVSTAATLEITTTSLPSGIEGQTYYGQLQAAGGNPPYTWTCISGSLPAIGLSLNTGTGEITGMPSAASAGLHSFTFLVQDSGASPQSAQKPLSITIFTPGGGWTRTADDCDFGPDDGNYKLIFEDDMIKLSPEGDVFGNVLDLTHWQETSGDYVETGGIVIAQSGLGGGDTLERQIGYEDADVAVCWSNTYPDLSDLTYGGWTAIYLGRDPNNWVRIVFFARKIGTPKCNFDTGKMIDGVFTLLDWTSGVGAQSSIRLRIRRRKSDNYFWVYYDIGAGWIETWNGVIDHTGFFDTSHSLKPWLVVVRGANTDDWRPEADHYYQYTGDIPAQRFWPDSPECDIIDSNAGTPEYCLDAGTGGNWTLTGFSAVLTEPGTSSIKFRAGWSDSPTRATATWINSGNWMTTTELDTQAAAGVLDGHRYIFLQAQFNSDSTDQPTLSSISFSGGSSGSYTASEFDTSPSIDDNNEKIIIDGGIAKLAPDADVFGSVINGWTEMSYGEIWSAGSGIGKGNAALSETEGVLTTIDGGSGDWTVGAKRNVSYLDADTVWHFSDTDYQTGTSYGAVLVTHLWVAQDTCIRFYDYVRAAAVYGGSVQKVINGVATSLGDYTHSPSTEKYYRIKLVRGTGSCVATAYTSTDGSNWVQRGSGECYDAIYFNENTPVYPVVLIYCENSADTFTPDLTNCYQYTGDIAAQRFWDDSPECGVVDSGAADWAFDAGAGLTWELSQASCVKSEPGTSTVLFKVGYSDTGNDADVTWMDATWQTISQVNTNAAAGNYDGHRYLHVKAQFNSDGTDQPTLSSFSINGAKVP